MHKIPFCIVFFLAVGACLWTTCAADPVVVDASKYADLQAALDAVPESGGWVQIPPGRFEIRQPLVVRTEDTRISGAGASTHLVNLNDKGLPALHLRHPDYAKNPRLRLWRIQLEDFRVSGNTNSGDGVLAQGIQEILVHGLSVDHNGRHGIFLDNCYEDPRVEDSILTYNKQSGLHLLACHDIVVNGNHFEENQDGLQCLDSFNLCMNGNNLDDHLRHGVVIENTYGSVLSGNMIEECNGIGVVLDRDCYGITVSANVIAHEFEGGIDLRDAWGSTISANTFTIVHRFGVRVGPESGRISVTGNTFANSHVGGKEKRVLEHDKITQIDVGTGVVLEYAKDVVVSGNVFSGLDGAAIRKSGEVQGVVVTGNLVTDYGRRLPEGPAIQVPDGQGNLVKDNLVRTRPPQP